MSEPQDAHHREIVDPAMERIAHGGDRPKAPNANSAQRRSVLAQWLSITGQVAHADRGPRVPGPEEWPE